MKRLGIFLYYDPDGKLDDYAVYFIKELKKHCDELAVVVNGGLDAEGSETISSICDKLLIRENVGFDSWAYKHAIETYGYNRVAKYDELLICNYTCFGPMYPFSELFDEMEGRDCDFWGVHRHVALPETFKIAGQTVGEHIQSHFIVFRKSILASEHFKTYWDTLRPVTNYSEAIAHHELRCTAYFEGAGYKSSCYLNPEKYFSLEPQGNASVFRAFTQLKEDRSPLLKRKVFFLKDGLPLWQLSDVENSYSIIAYIRDNLDYDTNLIRKNLERTGAVGSLSSDRVLYAKYILKSLGAALFFWNAKKSMKKRRHKCEKTVTKEYYKKVWGKSA